MLAQVDLYLKPLHGVALHQSMGSLLHGFLMEQVSFDEGEILHEQGLKPYSQYLFWDVEKKIMIWRVSVLNQWSHEVILQRVLALKGKKIYLQKKNIEADIIDIVCEDKSLSYSELADNVFMQENFERRYTLRFISPTSFKSAGVYMIYPYFEHIFKSLYKKFNLFSDKISLEDVDVLSQIVEYIKIVDYNLKMSKFSLERVNIPAFRGEVGFYINGTDSLARVAVLLLKFAEYSGVGAKTALGMGGVRLIK